MSQSTAADELAGRGVERIGLLAVHGIGDQGRFEFLDGLLRELVPAFRLAAGDDATVSVVLHASGNSLTGAAAVTLVEAPGPSAEIVIRHPGDSRETRIGVHEVWWGDINDPPTPFRPLTFFAWGLAMWAVRFKRRKELHRDAPDEGVGRPLRRFMVEPEPKDGSSRATRISVRLRLFFAGYLVVVLGIVLYLLVALIRFVTRQNIPDPVMIAISYMSDIKLYTQPTSPAAVPLDHLGQHARFAIRARAIRGLADMALAGYEQWYLFAHSLGSVIAFSGLMTPDGLIPRYLDEARWRRLHDRAENGNAGLVYLDPEQIPDDTNVAPVAWLPPGGCVSRVRLLEGMKGLVTYGCPLDKFAMLWPATIPLARRQDAVADKPWLNVYDATDPVAAHLDSFDTAGDEEARFRPTNIGYAASRVPLWSHIRYLAMPGRDKAAARDCLATRLARWVLGKDAAFVPGKGPRWRTDEAPAGVVQAWKGRAALSLTFWLALAVLGPLLSAAALLVLRVVSVQADSWAALVAAVVELAFAVTIGAILAVFAGGLLGRLLAFSNEDIDPDKVRQRLKGLRDGSPPPTPRPATKDADPYS